MDTFSPGTVEYDEAHGLYFGRGDRALVVSPGEDPPYGRRWERVTSLAHPGIAREMAETPAGRQALRDSVAFLHYGVTGQGQGVDVSEFQGSSPSGFSFAIPRLLNENNREDSRWRMHKNNYDAWGVPCGGYGIVRPGGDAESWANHFADLLAQSSWAFAPTIDVELGDAAANRAYVATAAAVLRQRGHRRVMGYFSTGGSYRRFVQDLFDLLWGACWGCAFPGGFHVHQWSGSPLDRDYCPDFAAISVGGATPAPPPEVQYGRTDDLFPRNPNNGTIWLLSGGHLRGLSGEDWAILLWEHAVQNGGKGPIPPNMDNDLRIVSLARIYGVPEAEIESQTGIDLGVPDDVLAKRLTADHGKGGVDDVTLRRQLAA